MHRGRIGRVALASVLAWATLAVGAPGSPTFAAACTGDPDSFADFTGMEHTPGGAVRGAQAYIEYIDHTMCGGSGDSFSSDWVAVTRSNSKYSIYQIGFDKCKGAACVGNPVNTVYYFFAYGRPAGVCGAAVGPEPQSLGIAPAGYPPRFKVERLPDPDHPNLYRYFLYIDGVLENSRPSFDLDTCWGGAPNQGEYFNEVYDVGTQSGGPSNDHQGFTDVRYKDSQYWRPVERPLGADCDLVGYANHPWARCKVSSTANDDWFSWDTRF